MGKILNSHLCVFKIEVHKMTDHENYEQLVCLFLPEGLLDYFSITNIILDGEAVNVHLEERNLPPSEYAQDKLESKGFLPSVTVQDFPLRDKALLLHLKRRRWLNHSTGNIVSRDWQLVASGTRLTKEFASFLKGAFGI